MTKTKSLSILAASLLFCNSIYAGNWTAVYNAEPVGISVLVTEAMKDALSVRFPNGLPYLLDTRCNAVAGDRGYLVANDDLTATLHINGSTCAVYGSDRL